MRIPEKCPKSQKQNVTALTFSTSVLTTLVLRANLLALQSTHCFPPMHSAWDHTSLQLPLSLQ